MWKGKVTQELRDLAKKYSTHFGGAFVDGYDDINPNAWTYEEFVAIIKEAIKKNVEIPQLFS